jgi:LPXTG-motif cell wall-anchored protein
VRIIVKFRRLSRFAAVSIGLSTALLGWALPARAATPLSLSLDAQSMAVTIATARASLHDCAGIPGGAKEATDGWVFDQPIKNATNPRYVIGFTHGADTADTVVILGISADGVQQLSLQGQPVPTTDGIAGGLLDNGNAGVWIQTPAGWKIATGVDAADTGTAGSTTFALAAVCPPKVAATPTARPAGSVTATAEPSSAGPAEAATTPSQSPGSATLPITGGRPWSVAGVGSMLLLLGIALVSVRRRRDRITFIP